MRSTSVRRLVRREKISPKDSGCQSILREKKLLLTTREVRERVLGGGGEKIHKCG